MEDVLGLTEGVKSGLRSFLVLSTFQPNHSLLRAVLSTRRCLAAPLASTHYKPMGEIADILKMSVSIKLLVKIQMCLSYQKKPYGLFGLPSASRSGLQTCKAREREGFIVHSPDAFLFPLRHKQEQETAPTKSGEEGW